jgi:hypothetical protein
MLVASNLSQLVARMFSLLNEIQFAIVYDASAYLPPGTSFSREFEFIARSLRKRHSG